MQRILQDFMEKNYTWNITRSVRIILEIDGFLVLLGDMFSLHQIPMYILPVTVNIKRLSDRVAI